MSDKTYFEDRTESQIREELDSFRHLDVEHMTIAEIEETIRENSDSIPVAGWPELNYSHSWQQKNQLRKAQSPSCPGFDDKCTVEMHSWIV